jgi:hypothetical protein
LNSNGIKKSKLVVKLLLVSTSSFTIPTPVPRSSTTNFISNELGISLGTTKVIWSEI